VSRAAWIRLIGLILILAGFVTILIWTVHLARIGLSLQKHLSDLQDMADSPETVEPAVACALVHDLRDDVMALRRDGQLLAEIAPLFGWLPNVGGDLKAAPHLLDVADGLTEAGTWMCDALEPALESLGEGTGASSLSMEEMLDLLVEQQPTLRKALVATERSQATWGRIDQDRLSNWLAGKVSPLDRGLPLMKAGLEAAMIAPDLLGVDGPRTYLILALNEDELRPGGGFISGVGEVRVRSGQLTKMTFYDSYAVDDFGQSYPRPPEPLQRYMGIEIWVFRDSNWSPDFPTAARQAIDLYRPGYPVSVDGVIAVDQETVRRLVDVIGPLNVEGADEPITGDTVIKYMRDAWAPEEGEKLDGGWWKDRKAFMGTLAQAVWAQIENGQIDWAALAETTWRLTQEKHLLIYLDHPEGAALLAEQEMDGALRARDGDHLAIVDGNVGYNKVNLRIQQEINYEVDLSAPSPQATLTLVYTHTSTADYPCVPEIRYDPTYELMADRCYWDYLRIYVPQNSQLLDATRIPVPAEALLSGEAESGQVSVQPAPEGPWTTFAVLGVLPPSQTQTRSFTWTLPEDVVQWTDDEGVYTLHVQKQPGTRAYPLTVRIRLPEEHELVSAEPQPTLAEKGWVVYQISLDRDQRFVLKFRKMR
jgi:hypothetical protein